jgi:hypothetical protein
MTGIFLYGFVVFFRRFAIFDITVDQLKTSKPLLWRQNPPEIVFFIIFIDHNFKGMLLSRVRQKSALEHILIRIDVKHS